MIFKFFYETDEQRDELIRIVGAENKKHFESFNNFDETVLYSIKDGKTFVYITVSNNAFIKDLQNAKDFVYEQNKRNMWHYLQKNPEDLPRTTDDMASDTVIIKLEDDSFSSGHWDGDGWYVADYRDGRDKWQNPIAWKEIETNEVLLTDFLSDVEENLSFVPEIEVQE